MNDLGCPVLFSARRDLTDHWRNTLETAVPSVAGYCLSDQQCSHDLFQRVLLRYGQVILEFYPEFIRA